MANTLEKISNAATTLGNIGTAAAPFLKPLSSVAGLGVGLVQSRRAKTLRAGADKLLPSPEDPEVRNLMNVIKRKAKAIETGTDPVTSAGKKIIAKGLATTQGNIVRSAAGDPRRVLEGLRRTSADAGDAAAKLTATTFPASRFYTELRSNLLNKISSRKFDLKMSQRAQQLREAAELKSASNRNIAGAIGFGIPI